MRKILILVLALVALWIGYWMVAARAVENGLTDWFEARRAEGWQAEYSDLNTHGFPYRFNTTIRDLSLADPRAGLAWSTPVFEIFALAFKPNHIIANWPEAQTFATPFQTVAITSEKMAGSIVFEPGTALTLDRTSFELAGVKLDSTLGWQSSLEKGRFATRQTIGRENAHDIFFEATRLRPSRGILAVLDPASLLPRKLEMLRLDMTVGFDAPWDRLAIERRRPQITSIRLKDLRGTWGHLDLRMAGQLDVGRDGTPVGAIEIRATNWRDMLGVAVDAGLVPGNISGTLEKALEMLAGMTGDPDTLDTTLTFKNGRMSFGPIPLGYAPNLTLR